MNSDEQYVNSEPMWNYCSRIEKKKKKENTKRKLSFQLKPIELIFTKTENTVVK